MIFFLTIKIYTLYNRLSFNQSFQVLPLPLLIAIVLTASLELEPFTDETISSLKLFVLNFLSPHLPIGTKVTSLRFYNV